MADELSFDLLAASLRQDTQDVNTFGEILAKKLEQAIPQWVQIERQGGLFQRSRAIKRITVTLDPWHYICEWVHGQPRTQRIKVVRGIAIKTESLDLQQWIEGLAQDLISATASQQAAREALERFLIR